MCEHHDGRSPRQVYERTNAPRETARLDVFIDLFANEHEPGTVCVGKDERKWAVGLGIDPKCLVSGLRGTQLVENTHLVTKLTQIDVMSPGGNAEARKDV